MSAIGSQLAIAAIEFLGTPFRLHGRDPRRGLDCVGLLIVSLRACGLPASDPASYGLRNTEAARHLKHLELSGFGPALGRPEPGDVMIARPGPGQHHVLICDSRKSFVHAHAGLRKVVRSTAACPWPILGHYRLSQSNRG